MSLTEKRKPDQSIDEETLSPAPKRRRNEEDLSSYSETENLQNRGSGVPENVSDETKSVVVLTGSNTTSDQFADVETLDGVEHPNDKVHVPNETNTNADNQQAVVPVNRLSVSAEVKPETPLSSQLLTAIILHPHGQPETGDREPPISTTEDVSTLPHSILSKLEGSEPHTVLTASERSCSNRDTEPSGQSLSKPIVTLSDFTTQKDFETVVPEIDGQLTKDPTESAKVEIQPSSTTTISDLNSVDLDIKPEIKQNKTDEDNSQSRSGPKFKYSRLYRLLRRNEDPKTDGIRAKLPDARVTIHDHVSVGSSHGSQYISTAASWGAIIAFARNKKWFPKIITTIDVEKLENVSGIQLIDLTDATKREANLHDQRAKNLARKYEEVLITGEIPPHCIIETTALLEPEPDSDSDFDFDSDFDSSDNDWY